MAYKRKGIRGVAIESGGYFQAFLQGRLPITVEVAARGDNIVVRVDGDTLTIRPKYPRRKKRNGTIG